MNKGMTTKVVGFKPSEEHEQMVAIVSAMMSITRRRWLDIEKNGATPEMLEELEELETKTILVTEVLEFKTQRMVFATRMATPLEN